MAKVYSSVSDFVLFPRHQPYLGTLDPTLGDDFNNMHFQPIVGSNVTRHEDFADQSSPAYESYPPVSAYSSTASAFYGGQNVPYENPKGSVGRFVRRQTPSGSPSPSVSQAFDHPPSTLSSASGASAQSTASSTDGSPYASATNDLPYEDKWSGPLDGLGIAPGIVRTESFSQDIFPPANFDTDLMLDDSKFANYVGECRKNSSPSSSFSELLVSSDFSALAPQNLVPAFSSQPLVMETTTFSKYVPISSILKDANCKTQNPVRLVPSIPAASAAAPPTICTGRHQTASPTQKKSLFKAPLAPSSAAFCFPSRATSPKNSGDYASLRHSVVPLDDVRISRSLPQPPERRRPCDNSITPPSSQHQALYDQSQCSFFGQSSGTFIAPLESSCWFP